MTKLIKFKKYRKLNLTENDNRRKINDRIYAALNNQYYRV